MSEEDVLSALNSLMDLQEEILKRLERIEELLERIDER